MLKDTLTIVVPTSCIPSHPATDRIERAIASIRAYPEAADCPLIITCDGLHPSHAARAEAYAEYKARLRKLYPDSDIVEFPEHTHQIGMMRATMPRIKTPLLFYVEHDFYLRNEIPWAQICAVMQKRADVKVVRLLHLPSIHEAWFHLMKDKMPQDVDGLFMVRTTMWSQNPHFATVESYRDILQSLYIEAYGFIEDRILGAVSDSPWERFGVWIYTGSISRVGHTNGREGDPKIG